MDALYRGPTEVWSAGGGTGVVTFVDVGPVAYGSGSVNVQLPATWSAGDCAVMAAVARGPLGTPAGWTVIESTPWETTSLANEHFMYYRILEEGDTYTQLVAGGAVIAGVMAVYAGVASASTVDSSDNTTGELVATKDAVDLTPTLASSLCVTSCSGSVTQPSLNTARGFTLRAAGGSGSGGSAMRIAIADLLDTAAGEIVDYPTWASGSRTATISAVLNPGSI